MKTEQQRIDGAIDTALLNADLLREQVAELEQALLAETEAKHEAVECLRRIVDGDESGELVELINGILSKHPEAADGVLAAAPAPVERVEQEAVAWRVSHPLDGWKTYAIYPDWAEGDDGFQIQPLYTTPQPAPTAAHDVAGLVEALGRALDFIRGDGDFEHREALERCECYACVTAEIIDSLAAHQSGGAK